MKRSVNWNLYVRDVYNSDNFICAAVYEEGDLGEFLEKFVDMADFGFNCYLEADVYYTKEENE